MLALQDGLSQLELKRKPSQVHSQSQKPELNTTKPTSPSEHTDSPSDGIELQQSKLKLHAELIDALREFASTSHTKGERSMKTRESVLEQAVIEQNQILDVMQEVIASLESENRFSREKMEAQSKLIQDSVGWESRARKAERKLRELREVTRNSSSSDGSSIGAIVSFEKALAQKDQLIASLQAKLHAVPLEVREKSNPERPLSASAAASSSSVRVHLAAERMRVIELEEELSAKKAELAKLKDKFSEHHSTALAKESEIQHLRHELEIQKKSGSQQQELVIRQRQAMMEKDVHLTSFTRALEKEKKIADQLRKKQLQSVSSAPSSVESKLANPAVPVSPTSVSTFEHTDLFDLVLDRDIHTVQITRPSSEVDLGFSYVTTDLPISAKIPCLIVKAIKKDSLAFGKLQPGDEILEVNGHTCRTVGQTVAVDCLEKCTGVIKIVLARDKDLSLQMQAHSTPVKSEPLGKSDHTTLWTTALMSPTETVFTSFTTDSSTLHEPGRAEYISFPNASKELPLAESITASKLPHISSTILSSGEAGENQRQSKQEEETLQELQTEVSELQDQLDESEKSRLELEEEIEALRSELDNLQRDFDSTKTENIHLKQQVGAHEGEVAGIQQNVLELQAVLVKLENQVTDDQERVASIENQNRGLSNELIEAKLLGEAATKEKMDVENELNRLKEELVTRAEADRKRDEDFQQLLSEKDQLSTDVDLRNARIKELSTQLEIKTTEHQQSQEEAERQSKQLLSEISALKQAKVKTSSSAQEEQEHLRAQFTSAKNLLMEAEMKLTQQKVEMRYLKQAADMANKQLEEIEEKYKKCDEDVSIYKQVIENKTLEVESLTLGLKATQHKLEAKQEMLSRLQNEVDSLRRNCAKLQNEKSHTVETMNKLKSSLNAAESEVTRLEKKLEASTDEKDTLFQQLEESISESTQLQQELDKVQGSLKEAEATKERVSQLSAKIEEMRQEKKTLEEELAKQVDSFKAERKVLESELAQSRSESLSKSTSVQEQVAKQEAEIKRQRDKLIACEGEKAKLSHSCDSLKKREAELLEQLQSLESAKESLTYELSTLKEHQKDTLRELEASQKKIETLNHQYSSVKEESQTVEAASETLRKELKDSKAENEMLNTNREELTQQLKTLQDQLDQIRSELDQKSQELQELKVTHSQLQEKTKVEQGHFEELRSSVSSLNDHTTKLQAEKKRSDDMVASLEFMHQQNQAKLEQFSETVKVKEAEVARFKNELEETTANLKKERVETATLKESLSGVKEQLDRLKERRNKEVAELMEQLTAHMKDVGELQEQLETEKSANAGHQSLIAQLKSNVEHANRERYNVQSSLDAALKEKVELETLNKQLEGQLARSKSEISQLEDSSNTLSSESASLKLQLKQSSRETDEVTAQLQAMEMNLDVANRTLDESERERLELTSQRENTELQLEDLKSTLKQSQTNLERTTLELHTREEELSNVKSNLDMRQRECDQLQESLIAARDSVQSYEMRLHTLQSEKRDLQATLEQLQEEQERLRSTLSKLEGEKQIEAEKLRSENDALQKQCEEFSATAVGHFDRMQRLELSKKEAEDTVTQLLAAQEALKNSLNSLGDEKDVEILRLQNQVSQFGNEIVETRQTLEQSILKGLEIEKQLQQLEGDHQVTLERCGSLEEENEALKREVQEHKNTADQLSELNSKMTVLQEGLRTKTERLSEVEQSLQLATSELKATHAENEGLLSKVSELASVKVSLVEKSTEIDQLRHQIATSSNEFKELSAERDHLLTTLRKLEVEKHSETVKPSTPELPRSAEVDKEQLLGLLRDKEEEASKLKDYVNKLLSAVVEKAPFVLENFG